MRKKVNIKNGARGRKMIKKINGFICLRITEELIIPPQDSSYPFAKPVEVPYELYRKSITK